MAMEKYRYTESEKALLEGLEIPLAVYQFIDKRVVTVILSKGFCDLFGYDDPAEAYYDMDNDMYKGTHPDDAARIADAAFRFATEGGSYDVIYRSKNVRSDGYNIIHAHGKHIYTDDGVRLAQVWYIDEGSFDDDPGVSDTMLTETLKSAIYDDSFIKASYYDHLTGLPGMTYFFELAAYQKTAVREAGGIPAMLFTDFSGMKYYNHKYGFAEGDKLLRSFARLLAKHFGNECCGRLGQDYFAVITENDGLENKLRILFGEVAELNEGRSLPVHIGINPQWFDGIAASMACDRAKFACDSIKSVYSSQFSYYNVSMKNAEEKQQYIIANIDRAISERWIKVYFQPIIRAVNGRVCDEEALARWIDPVKGFMSPADFIPILEDHRLIYKLDLYVVDSVIQKIRTLQGAGLHIMPQSVNLSRSDFDCCDMVEEIRRRVDAAGIGHEMITIEITESVIGQDFEFMKRQIERFREQGFAVWMDDFGSGYSSLDVLQSIKFDLIKFDMRFMQKFNEGNTGRIILSELLRMAASLGIDTVCEGVETEEQVTFLQETGCSKLQGYYFEKPVPVERILEKYEKGEQIGFEDPEESQYFEAVGRVNLHDLSVIAQGEQMGFNKYFDTLPMSIIEINDYDVRFARSNQSYREFMQRQFGYTVNDKFSSYRDNKAAAESSFMKALRQCCHNAGTMFIDEYFPGNTIVHSALRRIAVNTQTDTYAIAVAVLSISDGDKGTTYANIARALASDYFNLYYVNLGTERFIEYRSNGDSDVLAVERHGENFFSESRKDALKLISSGDRDSFIAVFTKENVLREIDSSGLFTFTYQLLIDGKPVYVGMKAVRMPNDPEHIIIGVSNMDSQMKQKLLLESARRTETAYSRIMALSDEFICIYTVDPATEKYNEYTASDSIKSFGIEQNGTHFFEKARKNTEAFILKDDWAYFSESFYMENVMDTIKEQGKFTLSYHLLFEDKPIPVILKAALVSEDDGDKLVIGLCKAKE